MTSSGYKLVIPTASASAAGSIVCVRAYVCVCVCVWRLVGVDGPVWLLAVEEVGDELRRQGAKGDYMAMSCGETAQQLIGHELPREQHRRRRIRGHVITQ